MLKINYCCYFIFAMCLLSSSLRAQPLIQSVIAMDTVIEQYLKFEAEIDFTASFTNPYNYDEIAVSGQFTSPDGRQFVVDGFYMKEYILDGNGNLTPNGEGFKIRFSPDVPGIWTYHLSVTDLNGTANAPAQSFRCTSALQINNKGFVRTGSTNYLQFDNGAPYIPIGENICWQNNNAYTNYKSWLDKLAANGGNFFRLWHAHWGLGIEWRNGWNGFQGLRKYKETNSRYQDWLFDYCSENGIYIMLCLQHHGPVSTQVNPNWNDSPYNAVNGGPCANTWDFFSNASARAHTKNRFRYIVARWGYAKSIMAWELFNEVEWTDNFSQHQVEVMEWHTEMAAYIKSIDPYGHLVTTSFAKDENDPLIWVNPDLDITQTHYYLNTPNIERALVRGNMEYLNDYDKPTLNGEFGLGLSSTLSTVDPNGIHIHNGLWASIFGGGLGTAMSWWWDIYIDPQNLYHHFDPVSIVAREVPFIEGEMQAAHVTVNGAPGDLSFTPTLGWGSIGESAVTIAPDGTITPVNPGLAIYLYGSQWNTQFRSPPVFTLTYPQSGTFSVKTSSTTGTSPRIAIYLDGSQKLNQPGQTNTTYTIQVPAGLHTIKVDNTGTDWITIASYSFSGLGSVVDAYVLRSKDQKKAAGWVINNQYTHEQVVNNGAPPPVSGAEVIMDGFADSTYFVKWYDCLTGALISSQLLVVTGNKIQIPVPELYWDLAFVVDEKAGNASSVDRPIRLSFEAYPNPVRSGESLLLHFETIDGGLIELLNMGGQIMQKSTFEGANEVALLLPFNISPGFYWIRVQSGEKAGTKAIVVGN